MLSLIAQIGTIEHGRRVAQSLISKNGQIRKIDEIFYISLPEDLPDHEWHERELDKYMNKYYSNILTQGFESLITSDMSKEVKLLLNKLVYPFRTHFIGYEAHFALDSYFYGHAYNEIILSKGFDTFHFATYFGKQTFQNYKLAATFIVSIGLKHRAFVRALIEKVPTIRIEDILTVSVITVDFLEGLREFINVFGAQQEGHVPVNDEDVKNIFDVLSISRKNLALLDRPGAPIPPLVQCSDEHVIRPLIGATSDGVMLFLLNSLQFNFPKEYDKAQRDREGVMQRVIEATLRPLLPEIEYRFNIKLKRNKNTLTDIDMILFERSTKHMVLIQLKHQDPYGEDIATKQARTGRLNQQIHEWLGKVRSWIASSSVNEIQATFRLPPLQKNPQISLLVVTRHYAHSLRHVVDGEDVSFANWTQFVTAVERLMEKDIKQIILDDLIFELKFLSIPNEEYYLPEPRSEWRVGNLHYTIEQKGRPSK